MAIQQFTQCVSPADFEARVRVITIQTLLAGVPAALIAVATNHPVCLWFVLPIMGLAATIAYCRNFLYARLICLGGDVEAIGMVVRVEDPSERPATDPDNDFSVNLLLCPNMPEVEQAEAEMTAPFGHLLRVPEVITNLGLGAEGYTSIDRSTNQESAILHCEFEGAGVHTWLTASEVGFAWALFALVMCLTGNIAVAIVLAILAFLAWLIGFILGKGGAGEPPGEVGEVRENEAGADGVGRGADILFIQGTWVYDPLHAGWNEIHPVKAAMKIDTWQGQWPPGFCSSDIILRLRGAFEDANREETRVNQQRPEHQWTVHPQIDGCETIVIT